MRRRCFVETHTQIGERKQWNFTLLDLDFV